MTWGWVACFFDLGGLLDFEWHWISFKYRNKWTAGKGRRSFSCGWGKWVGKNEQTCKRQNSTFPTTVCTLPSPFPTLVWALGWYQGKTKGRGTQSKIKTQAHQPTDIKIGWMESRVEKKKRITWRIFFDTLNYVNIDEKTRSIVTSLQQTTINKGSL